MDAISKYDVRLAAAPFTNSPNTAATGTASNSQILHPQTCVAGSENNKCDYTDYGARTPGCSCSADYKRPDGKCKTNDYINNEIAPWHKVTLFLVPSFPALSLTFSRAVVSDFTS